jgi:hypothetical protein
LLAAPVSSQIAGSPVASAMFPTRLLLPTFKHADKNIFESPSYFNVPDKIEPLHGMMSVALSCPGAQPAVYG